MKTKILAFVLVCVMVISMLPATAFAATVENIPDCPGTDKEHDLSNCPNGVYITTVNMDKPGKDGGKPVDSCKDAYDIYECPECDTEFHAYITPADHEYVKQTDVPATCVTTGKENFYVCSICGHEKFIVDPIDKVNGHKWVDLNEWDRADDDTNDYLDGENYKPNEETEKRWQQCSLCNDKRLKPTDCDDDLTDGDDQYDDVKHEHTWVGIVPEIIKKPTTTAEGLAKFTCPDCEYTEEVVIHNHNLTKIGDNAHKSTKYEATGLALDPTCAAVGYINEFYHCSICNLDFWTVADSKLYVSISAEDMKANTVAKLDHKHYGTGVSALLDWDIINVQDMVCGPTEADKVPGRIDYKCSICKEYVPVYEEPKCNYVFTGEYVEPTCFHEGYYVEACSKCHVENPEYKDAIPCIDHNDPLDLTNYVALDPLEIAKFAAYFGDLWTEERWNGMSISDMVTQNSWQLVPWNAPVTKSYTNPLTGVTQTKVYETKLPTCNQNGVISVYCPECDEYGSFEIKKLGHNADEATGYKNIITVEVPATCTDWGFSFAYCSDCIKYRDQWTLEGRDVDGESCRVNTKSTTNGKIPVKSGNVTKDIVVKYEMVEQIVDGNLWNVPTIVTDKIWYNPSSVVKTSNALGATAPDAANYDEPNHGGHVLQTSITETWTCTKDGEMDIICIYCNYHVDNYVYKDAGHNWLDISDWEKIEEAIADGKLTVVADADKATTHGANYICVEYKDATCLMAGYVDVTCSECGIWYSESVDAAEAEAEAVADATGYYPEYTLYGYLVEAKHVIKLQYKLDEAKHYHNIESVTPSQYRPGTCTIVGLDLYVCADCNQNVYVEDETTGYHILPTAAGDGKYFEKFENREAYYVNANEIYHPATCTEAAYWEAWTCQRGCGFKMEKTIDKTVNGGKKLGHDYSVKIADAIVRDCTTDGAKAIYQCSRCPAIDPNRNGAKTETKYHDLASSFKYNDVFEASCTENGVDAHWTCLHCDVKWFPDATDVTVNPATGTLTVVAHPENRYDDATEKGLVIPMTGHDYELIDSRDQNCLVFGYELYNCKNCANTVECDKQYITGYGAEMSEEPRHHDNGGKPRIDSLSVDAKCNAPGYDTFLCVVCGDYYKVTTTTPHKNSKGEVLVDICTDKPTDRLCVMGCGEVIGLTHPADKYVERTVEPTCNEIGYDMKHCSHCGFTEMTNEVPKLGHTFIFDEQTVYPTAAGEVGYRVCVRCYEIEEFKGVEYRLEVTPMVLDENNKPVDFDFVNPNYTDASYVKVSVYVQGLGVPDVLTLGFTISHTENVQFVSGKAGSEDFSIGKVSADVQNPNTVKGIYSAYDEYLGTAKEISLSGEVKLSEIIFQVRGYDEDHNKIDGTALSDNQFGFAVVDATALTAPDENMQTEEYWTLHALSQGKTNPDKSVVIEEYQELGDIDGDGDVTPADVALATSFQINNPEYYNSCLDIDRDGVFSFEDLSRLYGYYTGDADDVYNNLVNDYSDVTP